MSKTKGSLDEATSQTRITWASLSSTSSPRSTWCRQGFVFILVCICTSNSFVFVFFYCRQKPLPPIWERTWTEWDRQRLSRLTMQLSKCSAPPPTLPLTRGFEPKPLLTIQLFQLSQNHSLPFNYSKLDQYYFRLFNQGWATWKSLRVLQKDSECYEPDAEHYLGDPWRNTGSAKNKHKQHNHLYMFPSIIGHKPSGIHPGGGLGSGQRLRSGNCHSCLPHLRLPSNCTSHQVYEFTLHSFLTYQNMSHDLYYLCVGMQWKPSRFYL